MEPMQDEAKQNRSPADIISEWIECVTGEKQSVLSLAEWLRDGMILCRLINKIKPGTIKRINKMRAPSCKRENIASFRAAVQTFGVEESELFATPDLFEERDLDAVVRCIYTLGCVIQTTVPEFSGCRIQRLESTERKLRIRTPSLSRRMLSRIVQAAKPMKPLSRPMPAVSFQSAQAPPAKKLSVPGARPRSSSRSSAWMVADVVINPDLERLVTEWIENATEESKGPLTTQEWLKSGQVLCRWANTLRPGSVKKIGAFKTAWAERENIKKFLSAARGTGMAECSLFTVADLYDEKNMGRVIPSLYEFGEMAPLWICHD